MYQCKLNILIFFKVWGFCCLSGKWTKHPQLKPKGVFLQNHSWNQNPKVDSKSILRNTGLTQPILYTLLSSTQNASYTVQVWRFLVQPVPQKYLHKKRGWCKALYFHLLDCCVCPNHQVHSQAEGTLSSYPIFIHVKFLSYFIHVINHF